MPSAVVVTTGPVPRGAILSENDVTLQRMKPDMQVDDAFQSLDDVVGREAVLAIAPGQILDPQYIRTPMLVKRGSVVTVYVQAPGVKIRTTARAREDGSKGDNDYRGIAAGPQIVFSQGDRVDQVDVTPTSSTVEAETVSAKPDAATVRKASWKPRPTVTRASHFDDADPLTSGNRQR